ncbi:hypothetical protein HYFRA_00001666 [Hymenoscyphus fraxineus]|uniref:Type 1 phosphatases regulator n=1 Tax=Hymenoscyphus fraxineus TaxID=746836 RepID=A0A9N9L5B0_9HELO|nr:hypothetical protein HYFRA_00001666 [Hymenoscyphus fraxineus]
MSPPRRHPNTTHLPSTAHTQTQTQTRMQSSTSAAQPSGTQTQTITSGSSRAPVLHLRGSEAVRTEGTQGQRREGGGPRISWAEDVVDNEGLGRKKSKVCCIYHAPRGIDESSDESSSGSSSDESENDDGSARPSRRDAAEGKGRDCGHDHGKGKGKGKERKRSPNAYEKMPRSRGGGVVG